MIEINLIEKKAKMQLPVILGMDLNFINWKGLIMAVLISKLGPPLVIGDRLKNEFESVEKKNKDLRAQLKDLQKKSRSKKDIEVAIESYIKEEKILQKRLVAVKEVIKQKKNPWRILHYLSKNIPEDVWLNNLTIIDDEFTVQGEAKNYPAIGLFLENLERSVFFIKGQPNLEDSKTIENPKFGIRTESFVVKGKIKTYE